MFMNMGNRFNYISIRNVKVNHSEIHTQKMQQMFYRENLKCQSKTELFQAKR